MRSLTTGKGGIPSPAMVAPIPGPVGELGHLVNEIQHRDIARLEEAVEAFARAPSTNSGFPTVRPANCRKITEGFSAYLRMHSTSFPQGDPVVLNKFFGVLDRFAESDVRAYPNESLRLELVRIEALLVLGRYEEALSLSAPMANRPYLIEGDVATLNKLFDLDATIRLSLGHCGEVEEVAYGRLLLALRGQRKAPHRQLERFIIQLEQLVPAVDVKRMFAVGDSRLDSTVGFIVRLCLEIRRRTRRTKFARLTARFFVRALARVAVYFAAVARLRSGLPRVQIFAGNDEVIGEGGAIANPVPRESEGFGKVQCRAEAKGILVTRAMGGLGDILMMTPGLTALGKKLGRPVDFATKRQFFPVLENNPYIRPLDIDGFIDLSHFSKWIDLSYCPASRHESKNVPHVRKGRVELFAEAMGIDVGALESASHRPVCNLSEKQQQQRMEFRAKFESRNLPIIGFQPYSRETYRNYPGIFNVAEKLAGQAHVVYFHSSLVQVAEHTNIAQVCGYPLRETLAAIAACDYFVCVDSSFFHVAAAFDIPTVGIFGPTNGRVRAQHHPRSLLVEASESFTCAPCWRNEDTPCYVTGGFVSKCMSDMPPQLVVDKVVEILGKFPMIGVSGEA